MSAKERGSFEEDPRIPNTSVARLLRGIADGVVENRNATLLERVFTEYRSGRGAEGIELLIIQNELLELFEDQGLLPKPLIQNPFDPSECVDEFESWANQHPMETKEFSEILEKRTEILGYLYVGAAVEYLLGAFQRDRQRSQESDSLSKR